MTKRYLVGRLSVKPRLDDAARRAVFLVAVEEGPQFRMGALTFEGIRESDATNVSKKWKLKAGDVYDESYEQKYLREEIFPLQTSAGGRGRLSTRLDPDRHVVDVKISFQ
jgi:outer membrane translocation and assembly module TamA